MFTVICEYQAQKCCSVYSGFEHGQLLGRRIQSNMFSFSQLLLGSAS